MSASTFLYDDADAVQNRFMIIIDFLLIDGPCAVQL